MRSLSAYSLIAFLITALSPPAAASAKVAIHQKPLLTANIASPCDCTGDMVKVDPQQTDSICGDPRLGPIRVPAFLPVISLVSDYDRFGIFSPGEFLQKYWDGASSQWKYPEGDGFNNDNAGKSIRGIMTLYPGTLVDRFGSEKGHFVAGADAPFNQRSLPPSSLNTFDGLFPANYHVYKVEKPFHVEGGPVAPWFQQPGLGAQFFIGDVVNPDNPDAKNNHNTTIAMLLKDCELTTSRHFFARFSAPNP